jgi:S1-C subfamily serine protease
VRAGDAVIALGYPLSGLLATTANLTVGNVSALAGLGDDSRYLQISAPVQPGNSGGPLLDASGHLVGIVTAKLDAALVARFTGDIPQNVNFALKAEVARTFLESKGIAYQTAHSDQQLSPADVGDIARPFTVRIECEQAVSRSAMAPAAAPAVASPSAPSRAATARVFRADFYLAGCKDFLAGEANFLADVARGPLRSWLR